jgi:hypothetical protein
MQRLKLDCSLAANQPDCSRNTAVGKETFNRPTLPVGLAETCFAIADFCASNDERFTELPPTNPAIHVSNRD